MMKVFRREGKELRASVKIRVQCYGLHHCKQLSKITNFSDACTECHGTSLFQHSGIGDIVMPCNAIMLSHKTAVFLVTLLLGDDTGVASLGSRPELWCMMAMPLFCPNIRVPISLTSHQQDPRESRELQLELTWLQDVLKGKQYLHLRDTTMTFFLDSLYSLFYLQMQKLLAAEV